MLKLVYAVGFESYLPLALCREYPAANTSIGGEGLASRHFLVWSFAFHMSFWDKVLGITEKDTSEGFCVSRFKVAFLTASMSLLRTTAKLSHARLVSLLGTA